VLLLNDEESVKYREFVLGVIVTLEEKRRRIQETTRRIAQQWEKHPERAEQLAEERASAERALSIIERHLARVAGTL
jgi:hypothetical protein